jgi:hypothetical protein
MKPESCSSSTLGDSGTWAVSSGAATLCSSLGDDAGTTACARSSTAISLESVDLASEDSDSGSLSNQCCRDGMATICERAARAMEAEDETRVATEGKLCSSDETGARRA